MLDWLLNAVWYAALAYAAYRAWPTAKVVLRLQPSLSRAQGMATFLSIAGTLVWLSTIVQNIERKWQYRVDPAELFEILMSALMWALLVLLPTWLPGRLLAGNPGPVRCWGAITLGAMVAVFAAICIGVGLPFLLFSNSASQFYGALLQLTVPIGAIIFVAASMSKSALVASRR